MYVFSSLVLDNIYKNSEYFDELLNDSMSKGSDTWELNDKNKHATIRTFDSIKEVVQYADGYYETIAVNEEEFSIDARFIQSGLIKEYDQNTNDAYFKRGLIEFHRNNDGLWILVNGSGCLVDEFNGFAFGCCKDLLCTVMAYLTINEELLSGLLREGNCKDIFAHDEITVIYPELFEDPE